MSMQSLSETTKQTIEEHFEMLGDNRAKHLYQQIIEEVECSLLQEVMKHNDGNQSKTALCLGINLYVLN